MKKLLVSNFIILICFSAFMLGYSSLEGISFADTGIEWENCTTAEEQAEAFKAYCKSRDLTIEGSIADAVTSFTTQTYQTLVNTLGLDINALQADIKRATDSNGAVKYLFDASGISAMNRIFSQFLQDHDLSVGDIADDQENTVFSGEYYTDEDGYSCLVFVTDGSTGVFSDNSHILQFGSFYKYDSLDIKNIYSSGSSSLAFNLALNSSDVLITGNIYLTTYNSSTSGFITRTSGGNIKFVGYDTTLPAGYANGYPIIYRYNTYYYLGCYSTFKDRTNSSIQYQIESVKRINTSASININLQNTIIYLTTNNQTINNNDYSDNSYTVINNDGDVYNYDTDDEPDPDTPVTPPDPPTPDEPSGGTPPDDWDIELPDLSNTDWVIYGLEKKFPWDIPFNMMFILSLLNAEPITPHFEGSIDLKVCTWDYDLDLEPFDTIAGYVREFMFLSFIIGLMLMTKNLIWG